MFSKLNYNHETPTQVIDTLARNYSSHISYRVKDSEDQLVAVVWRNMEVLEINQRDSVVSIMSLHQNSDMCSAMNAVLNALNTGKQIYFTELGTWWVV
jgi:hypothetical protein